MIFGLFRMPLIRRHCLCLFTLVSLLGFVAPRSWAVNLAVEIVKETGLTQPVFGAAPAGQNGVLYISELQNADIRILDLQTKALTTFLNLPNITGGQKGLQAFAFHPDYASNGKFYVNLSELTDGDTRVKILEFQRSAENPMLADITTKREILSFSNSTQSHNGGWLGFSPVDGMLYVTTGDGGAIGSPSDGLPAQDPNELKGKVLRIDVDADDFPADTTRNYAIPSNNPFAISGGAPEVFALGLRHPYRASFDDNGDLYIADVGGTLWEEVNFIPAGTNGGQNFGWRPLEGPFDNPGFPDSHPPDAVDPIHYYDRGVAAAIIGGYVYRGQAIPGLAGHYIYTDNVTEAFGTFSYDGTTVSDFVDRTLELAHPTNVNNYSGIASWGKDAQGELYFFDTFRGDVFKIVAGATIAGDFDEDGDVDGRDFLVWQSNPSVGNLADWQTNYGNGPLSAATSVPEPTASVLLLSIVGCWALLRAR